LALFLSNLDLIAALIVARAIPSLVALVAVQRAQLTVTLLAATATRGLAASMALLGGPIGVAALAAVGLWAYFDATESAADATARLGKKAATVSDELNKLTTLKQLTSRADFVRKELQKTQDEIDKFQKMNEQAAVFGGASPFESTLVSLRQKAEELGLELDLVGEKQQSVFERGITRATEGGIEQIPTELSIAVKMAKEFADEFERASDAIKTMEKNLEKIQKIGEERVDKRAPTVLGALTKAGLGRLELERGNVERASELALEAAKELRAVEEETGKQVTLAGTFIKNFEQIAEKALSKAEETQEALRLVIVIEGVELEFPATKEGAKAASKATSDAVNRAKKRGA
jgi:hypothetical protein